MLKLCLLAAVAFSAAQAVRWPSENGPDESTEKSIEDYDCSTDGRCDLVDDALKKKKGFSFFSSKSNPRQNPVYTQNVEPFSCSCAAKMITKNLGRGYYPQHVLVADCKHGSCFSGFKCREKNYTILVLRRRETDENVSLQSHHKHIMPKDLRKFWGVETVEVPIGCECGPVY